MVAGTLGGSAGRLGRQSRAADGARTPPALPILLGRQRFTARSHARASSAERRQAHPGLLCLRLQANVDTAHRGDKTGNDRFYEDYVPVADDLYDEHLDELRKEGLIE